MSTNVPASFGSYPHPFCGSRATRIRMYPSASQSEQRTVSRTRPFTGNEASNSRPDLIGRGTNARTAAAPINPTTRELQVVAGLYTSEERGSGIPEERLVHNYLVEAGLAARIPKGIRIWEETLRDGEQTPGVAYTPEEKVRIARVLDEVHVPMMEVGIPVVSSEEARGVRMIANAGLDATVLAAARTVRKDVEACIACDVDEIALFTAGSDLHIKHKLAMTREQVKEAAVRETEYAVAHGVDVSFVTEDTFRADLDFVVDLYNACTNAGAHRAVVCDTVGVMTPPGIRWFFGQLKERLVPTELSFPRHHNFGPPGAHNLPAGADRTATDVRLREAHGVARGRGEAAVLWGRSNTGSGSPSRLADQRLFRSAFEKGSTGLHPLLPRTRGPSARRDRRRVPIPRGEGRDCGPRAAEIARFRLTLTSRRIDGIGPGGRTADESSTEARHAAGDGHVNAREHDRRTDQIDHIEPFVPHAGAQQSRGDRRDDGEKRERGRLRNLEQPLPWDERDDGSCGRKEQDRSNALRP